MLYRRLYIFWLVQCENKTCNKVFFDALYGNGVTEGHTVTVCTQHSFSVQSYAKTMEHPWFIMKVIMIHNSAC